jgi:predicted phosphodiesterase
MRRLLFLSLSAVIVLAEHITLPNKPESVHFAVIGDTGTGGSAEYDVAKRLTEARSSFPFDFVLMMGDNLYGGEKPKDFEKKFAEPYKALLDGGVKFYAVLGNHDDPNERFYEKFNMGGERFYTFKVKGVRYFALDSNYMDPKQLAWLEKELKSAGGDWKIAFFHHPLYSSGEKHGSDVALRAVLEPLFVKYGVDAVFSGHEHFYERIKPQRAIYYFICGSSAKLREGNIHKTELTEKGFDSDNTFILVEIGGNRLSFQTISRTGQTIDAETLTRPNAK